jgi:ATP-dependent exoDNAse (exonuclease V) alpha subunit
MAIFRLQIQSLGRTAGRQATGAAAYRAGERIRDERTGELHNHSSRKDVTHKEIMLPSKFATADLEWARDRSRLWNAAEQVESRKDARVAREFQVTLPAELSAPQRLNLARSFSQELADRYNIAVDLAVHDPRPNSDPRNFHAHLLTTTREVTLAGLGAKAGLDMSGSERSRRGLPTGSQQFVAVRERWATLTNEALRDAHIDARVDHRSLEAQGIDREPKPRIPFAAFQIEQRGERSEVGERLRAQYSERVQARAARSAGREAEQKNGERNNANDASPAPQKLRVVPKSLEDIRREARENWLKMRAVQSADSQPRPADEQHIDRGPSDDHSP